MCDLIIYLIGKNILTVLTANGPITVNEADYVVIGENGRISIG